MPQWIGLEASKFIMLYNYVLAGTFSYYSHIQNTDNLRRIQFILQMSYAKTLAHKYKCSAYKVFRKYGKNIRVPKPPSSRKSGTKEHYIELHIRDKVTHNEK